MFERVLHRIRELVRADRYVLTTHAYEELLDDGLTIGDVEHAILTGRIVERQMDRVTGETCDLCGRPGARTRRTTRMFGSGASIVVIEGIPIVRCASCGEGYLTATTLKVIDRIRKQRRKLGRRSVAVAKFEGAA